jgi:hypothetical protein
MIQVRQLGFKLWHRKMPTACKYVLGFVSGVLVALHAGADPLTDRLDKLQPKLVQLFGVPLEHWRFHQPDIAGAEQTNFDDSSWTNVAPGFFWSGENTKVWFRTVITIPSTAGGQAVEGNPVRLDLGVDDDGEIYLDGRLREAFHWDEGHYTLLIRARPSTWRCGVSMVRSPASSILRASMWTRCRNSTSIWRRPSLRK